MPDLTTTNIDLEPLTHMESEYGVFVSNSGKDLDKLKMAKQMGQAMLQNGVPASSILEMFDTENFAGIKEKIRVAEASKRQLEEAQRKAQQEQGDKAIMAQQKASELESIDKERDRQAGLEKALIAAETKSNDGERFSMDLEKMRRQLEQKDRELDLKEQALKTEGDLTPDGE